VYTGELDRDFTGYELKERATRIKSNTAVGLDGNVENV
jgi:hypothetical protein